MKKIYILPVFLLCLCFFLVGCNSDKLNVKIYLNNGSDVIESVVNKGDTITLPTNIISDKEYLEFDDWYLNSSFLMKFDSLKALKSDTNIYAKWKFKEGYGKVQVFGGSMTASGIKSEDYVVIQQLDLSQITTESIILYYNSNIKANNEETISQLLTTKTTETTDFKTGQTNYDSSIMLHQVIAIYYDLEGHTWFETKGTSNAIADSTLVRGDYVIGQFVDVFNNYRSIIGL